LDPPKIEPIRLKAKIVPPMWKPKTRKNSDKREDSKITKVRGDRIWIRRKIRANQIYPVNFGK
jgi:hypothetical protein